MVNGNRLKEVMELRTNNYKFMVKLHRHKEYLEGEISIREQKIQEIDDRALTAEHGWERNNLFGESLRLRGEIEQLKSKILTCAKKIYQVQNLIKDIDIFIKQARAEVARQVKTKLLERQRADLRPLEPQPQSINQSQITQNHIPPARNQPARNSPALRVPSRGTKSRVSITERQKASMLNSLRRKKEADRIKSQGSFTNLTAAEARQRAPRLVDNVTKRKIAVDREKVIENKKVLGAYKRKAADVSKSRSDFPSLKERQSIQMAQEKVKKYTKALKTAQLKTVQSMIRAGAELKEQKRKSQQSRLVESSQQPPSGVEAAIQAIHEQADKLGQINWARENANLKEIVEGVIKEFCQDIQSKRSNMPLLQLQNRTLHNLSQILDVILVTKVERFQHVNPNNEKMKMDKILADLKNVINTSDFFDRCYDVTMSFINKHGFTKYPQYVPRKMPGQESRGAEAFRKQTQASLAKTKPTRSDTSILGASRSRTSVRPGSSRASLIPQVSESRIVRSDSGSSVDSQGNFRRRTSRPKTADPRVQRVQTQPKSASRQESPSRRAPAQSPLRRPQTQAAERRAPTQSPSRRPQTQAAERRASVQSPSRSPQTQASERTPVQESSSQPIEISSDSSVDQSRPRPRTPRRKKRVDKSQPSYMLMSQAQKHARVRMTAFKRIPDTFRDLLSQFCNHVLLIKNSQETRKEKIVYLLKVLQPFVEQVVFMRYPKHEERPQRAEENTKWTAAIVNFVDLILTQNLTISKCEDITVRGLHKTGAIPLTDGQKVLIKFLTMIEKLVEPCAEYFGNEVLASFIEAGIIRDDRQKRLDVQLEKKRSTTASVTPQPPAIQVISATNRVEPTAGPSSRMDPNLLRLPSRAPAQIPVPDQDLFQSPSRPSSQPQDQPSRPPSLLRPPTKLSRTPSRLLERPASRQVPEQSSRQPSRTPVRTTSRPVTPQASQVQRKTPARGLQRSASRSSRVGTPRTPRALEEDTEEARIRRAELKRPKLVDRNYIPFECITPDGRKVENIPDNLIVNDLLGLGCVLLKNPYLQVSIDGTVSDGLVLAIRRVAEYWSSYEISKARAFQTMAKLLENIPCFPRELYNLLCVVIKDYFFPEKSYVHKAYEIQARSEKIKNVYRNLIGVCPEEFKKETRDAWGGDFLAKYLDNESVVLKNDPDIIAEILITAERGVPITGTPNNVFSEITQRTTIMSSVKISGREILQSDPAHPLALVSSIDKKVMKQTLGTRTQNKINTQLQLLPGPVPQPNIAKNLLQHLNEVDDNVNIARDPDQPQTELPSNNVFLIPKPLVRQNFCQLRGSELPKWFPGYYATFPDSGWKGLKPVKSPSYTLLSAWRKMGPIINRT